MKLFATKKILPIIIAGGLLFSAKVPACAEDSGVPTVSHGLTVLSAATDVALSAMVGNDIAFCADDFARGMNLSEVRYLTVTSIPSVTEGELLLGSSRVVSGQTVAAANLSAMAFHPADESVRRSSFTFTVNGGATPMICNLYLLDRQNYTPTVSMASGLSLQNNTHRNLAAYGTLSAYDPDGDRMTFEITSYPKNGTVLLTDAAEGTYVYRPNEGYIGSDRFSYVARDLYGNYSAAATVSLRVDLSGTSVTYADMVDSPSYNAALTVTEKGIMSGTQVGNTYYFYPDQTVSRVEFLVMAMNAVGITDVPDCKATVFADDDEIPATMKGYVAAAYELGFISGSQTEGNLCFLPDAELTRAQAAVILEKVIGLESATVIPTFADGSEIPVWAQDAVYSLSAAGIMTPSGGYISPSSAVTRADTAELLTAMMNYKK